MQHQIADLISYKFHALFANQERRLNAGAIPGGEMKNSILSLIVWLVLISSGSGSAIADPSIGSALAVTPGAELVTDGRSVLMVAGMQVSSGDTVITDSSGQVQLLFDDETKIVVGPRSRLEIDNVLLNPSGTAKRFVINALGGKFRFISGKSAKKVYNISTPTATMGIRGTIFDLSVESGGGTSVVLFEGEFSLCLKNGVCENVAGSCALSQAQTENLKVGDFSRKFKNQVLRNDFPYVVSQQGLLDPFHAPTNICGDISEPDETEGQVIVPTPPDPVPEPEPDPEPEPESNDDHPGQSGAGNSDSSAGHGNETSRLQHGTGTGSGQGPFHRHEK
ncbi:MAG: FecR family protein [Paracoccaceae bacterium]